MWLYAEGMSKSRRYPGGRATTLKPAFEPIVLARRELDGTTEETIARHGTGALNAESCRVEGRHPANVVLGHDPDCEEESCAPGCAVGRGRRLRRRRPLAAGAEPVPLLPEGESRGARRRLRAPAAAAPSTSSRTPARAATPATPTRP